MPLDQIINTGRYVQSDYHTEIVPVIRSVDMDWINLDRIKKQIPKFFINMF